MYDQGTSCHSHLHCDVCDLYFTSQMQLDQHLVGKNHMRKADLCNNPSGTDGSSIKASSYNRETHRWERNNDYKNEVTIHRWRIRILIYFHKRMTYAKKLKLHLFPQILQLILTQISTSCTVTCVKSELPTSRKWTCILMAKVTSQRWTEAWGDSQTMIWKPSARGWS